MGMKRHDCINYGLFILIIGAICLNGGLLINNVLNERYGIAVLNAVGLALVLVALSMAIQTFHRCREIDRLEAQIDAIDTMMQRMG
jgi:uncharacterized membrane protein YqgA involved in biofilm formation